MLSFKTSKEKKNLKICDVQKGKIIHINSKNVAC